MKRSKIENMRNTDKPEDDIRKTEGRESNILDKKKEKDKRGRVTRTYLLFESH